MANERLDRFTKLLKEIFELDTVPAFPQKALPLNILPPSSRH